MHKQAQLLELNVNKYTENKNGLTYLSWASAWQEFIKVCPTATYTVHKNDNGECWFGNAENGYMVYTSVTVDELTHEMWLPVMDYRNKSMLKPTTFDINKAVMRCLTKNLAMFGLGLYIYKGEDLPEQAPTGVKCTDLIEEGGKKNIKAGAIEKISKRDYGHGLEFITQSEHDELLAKLKAVKEEE